jgi:hypothetical protein
MFWLKASPGPEFLGPIVTLGPTIDKLVVERVV